MRISVAALGLFVFLLPSPGSGGALPIDSFTQNRWMPGPDTPKAEAGPGLSGARFHYRFDGKSERVYWDRPVRLDLSPYQALELDLTCRDASAIQSIAVYLKSGNGWYVWINPVNEPGRRKLRLDLGSAGTEGRPAGMNRISGIRISLQGTGKFGKGYITAHSLAARVYPVTLVRATGSAPNVSERSFSAGVARRVSGWLSNAGVDHVVISDDEIEKGIPDQVRLVVLCYNPVMPEKAFRQLNSFVGRGGKLVVFYSSDARLAGLMGVRLGEYTRSSSPAEWTHFTFSSNAPEGVPKVVYQESGNIRPVFPASEGAAIIARWNSDDGKPGHPAWVKTKNGLWMSHVLLRGDDESKTLMMPALLGEYLPSVRIAAAEHLLRSCGRFGPFLNANDAMTRLRQMAPRNKRANVNALLKKAQSAFDDMCRHYGRREYSKTVQSAMETRNLLIKAFALVQEPGRNELRGVWDHSGTGLFPGNWNATCRLLAASGINAIFPNLAWAGTAHYKSAILPGSFQYRQHGNQLDQCIAAAKRFNMEVHAWKICWHPGQAGQELIANLRAAGRLQVTSNGQAVDWLCPAHPANIKQELAVIRELASKPGITGVHLDYIRFPSSASCFCNNCRNAFEKWRGGKISDWPAAATGKGRHRESFRQWRCAHITDFVASARNVVKKVNPKIQLSAAVYMNAANAQNLGQDWPAWMSKGLLDFVCPMNYTESTVEFENLLLTQRRLVRNRSQLVSGIGVTASESRLSPDQVIEQISVLRNAGLNGFVLFDLNSTLQRETLPLLRIGVTSDN